MPKEHEHLIALLKEKTDKITKIEREYYVYAQVLLIAGKDALDNCIWYDSDSTKLVLAFNWNNRLNRASKEISNDVIDKVRSLIDLPDGATVINELT